MRCEPDDNPEPLDMEDDADVDCGNGKGRGEPIPIFAWDTMRRRMTEKKKKNQTRHQSMNGEPRCGTERDVRDKGLYSRGLICVIKWRQSRPP